MCLFIVNFTLHFKSKKIMVKEKIEKKRKIRKSKRRSKGKGKRETNEGGINSETSKIQCSKAGFVFKLSIFQTATAISTFQKKNFLLIL